MTSTSRGVGDTGARSIITGTQSNGSTWWEDVLIKEDGTVIAGADAWEWRLTLRDASAELVLTLSTTDGTLTISQGASATILQIRVAYTVLSTLDGDYICDIASMDTTQTPDRVVHWGHGTVTFRNEPVWSA